MTAREARRTISAMASRHEKGTNGVVRVELLGAFHVKRGAQEIRLVTRKIESLLAFLVLHPGEHTREKLAALFWGEVSDEQARGSLRKALTHLRAALGDEIVLADRQVVQLNPDAPLTADVREFNDLVAVREWGTLERLNESSAALARLYLGELGAGLYDDWLIPLRQDYESRYVETLLRLTQEYRSKSEYRQAIQQAERIFKVEPANEPAHQHLIFCYIGLGDRLAAIRQYEECVRALTSELGVEPSAETSSLYRWIQQSTGKYGAREALVTNLPVPLSSFVGRESETANVSRYLNDSIRLVTLTGPGGSGKTRLAIQTATDLICSGAGTGGTAAEFPDGVWWVELASISDRELISQQIAQTLGVRENPQEPLLMTLTAFLEPKRMLLILDNCEHVLEAAAETAQMLLERCAGLTIMATSREALRITGEQVYPVPSLSVPRRDAYSYPDLLRGYEGIRLFVERAQAVNPIFVLDDANAAIVAQICARLDGIPLALELAASRTRVLSVQEIAARLDARFDLLKDANRAAPPRHQTLRAVLDWSCELLNATERVFLQRLAVFAGGFTLASAEALMVESDAGKVLDTLTHLVDKSLVSVTLQSNVARYGMLETIREYAFEMLKASDEQQRIRMRHLEVVLDVARRAERELRGPRQMEWLERLDSELDNIRAALEWSVTAAPDLGLEIAGRLEWFWNLRGHWNEGASWLERVSEAADRETLAVARGLVAAGNLKYWGDQDYAGARTVLERAIAIYESRSDSIEWDTRYAHSLLGATLINLDEPAAARRSLEIALEFTDREGTDWKWVAAWAWLFLGWINEPPEAARENMETSVAMFRELGDLIQLPVAPAHLAWLNMAQGDYAAAERHAEEGMALTVAAGDALGIGWYHKLFGDLAQYQQKLASALAHYQAALEQFQRVGNRAGMNEVRAWLVQLQESGPP